MTKWKKRAGIIALVLLLLAAARFGWRMWLRSQEGQEDLMEYPYQNSNINTLLVRRGDWQRIVKEPLFEKQETMMMIDGSTATVPITAELLRQFYGVSDYSMEGDGNGAFVAHATTHEAYVNLVRGNSRVAVPNDNQEYEDVHWDAIPVRILFATPPSADELQMAKEQNAALDVQPLARDGFVFITHKDNPVESLTVEQVQQIYSGKIKNWQDVGGRDEKIRAYQREPNSGSQTAMEQLVMQGIPMQKAVKTMISTGMGALVERVAEYQNGSQSIGYTYYYYINNLYKSSDIKVLKINGIPPENENLVTKRYPFTADYCVVIREDEPQNSDARKLRDYMLSKEGQEIVEMAGYCPVSAEGARQ